MDLNYHNQEFSDIFPSDFNNDNHNSNYEDKSTIQQYHELQFMNNINNSSNFKNESGISNNYTMSSLNSAFNNLTIGNFLTNTSSVPSPPKNSKSLQPNENFVTRLLIENNIPDKNHEIIHESIEKWKQNISMYLTTQTSSTSMNEIYHRVPAIHVIPKIIKLIDILKYDSENRFYVTGDGNNVKVKFNFKLTDQEIELLQTQWRESISKYLSTQSSAISLSDIGANVNKPFHLPNTIKLLDTIQSDPLNRFVVSGTPNLSFSLKNVLQC